MLQRGFASRREAPAQLGHPARDLAEVYARLETTSLMRTERTLRVPQVSNLDNNPLGIEL